MNLVVFGYYGFKDGYYAYGKYFQSYFKTVSFFPLIEFRDLIQLNITTLNDIDQIIAGSFTNHHLYSNNLIYHNVPQNIVLIAHNNDLVEQLNINNVKLIDCIQNLKNVYDFKLVQINWDCAISSIPPSPHFDLSFNSDPHLLSYPNTKFFPQGFCPSTSYFYNDSDFQCDVSFIGTNLYTDPQFPNKSLNRKQILDLIYQDKSIKLHIYGPEFLKELYPDSYKGFISYNHCYKVFSNSTICLNISPLVNIENKNHFYYSERLPQILACNSIILSNNHFYPLLEPNKHYLLVEKLDQVLPTIHNLLQNEDLIGLMKENIKEIVDSFNYKSIVPSVCNDIFQLSYRYAFFLLNHTYSINHILSHFIDQPITLIYISYSDTVYNHYKIYQQECLLKHINRLQFNYKIIYIDSNRIEEFLHNPYLFLNFPLGNQPNDNKINPISITSIFDKEYIIDPHKINCVKNIGHGVDEETLISFYIENNFQLDDKLQDYVQTLKYEKYNNIVNLHHKQTIFSNIYKLNSSKKTIIFLDNYLYPFLTSKDANYDPYGYTILMKIIKQLIELKKDYNVIVRFHPFNEFGVKVGQEFPSILLDHFIIDFTPFELPLLYQNADIIISNRFTSAGLEAVFSDCPNLIFIDYNYDKRKLPNNYIQKMTNEQFEKLLESNYILNSTMIPVVNEHDLNLLDIIYSNKFYKHIDDYKKIYFNQ